MAVALCFVCVAGVASADDDELPFNYSTLLRSVTNMAFAPLDLVLSPMTTTVGIFEQMRDIDDSRGVRLAYPPLVWLFVEGTNIGCSVIRFATGALEFVPGVILLATKDTELDPLFNPVDDARAYFEFEPEVLDYQLLRFGLNYTIAEF